MLVAEKNAKALLLHDFLHPETENSRPSGLLLFADLEFYLPFINMAVIDRAT